MENKSNCWAKLSRNHQLREDIENINKEGYWENWASIPNLSYITIDGVLPSVGVKQIYEHKENKMWRQEGEPLGCYQNTFCIRIHLF